MSSLNLAPEIIDRILLFSPTFATLKSAILTCKSFHDVFSNHPKSIVRAVAYNVAGPALPQLVRVIRYEALAEPRPTDTDDIPAESNDISPITSSEVAKIVSYANVARKLEDVFSMRHKNRSSRISTLTSLESWRFRRAIYRLMMYSTIFPGNRFTDMDILAEEFNDEDDDDDDARALRYQKEQRVWKKFWQEFDTSELCEVRSAAKFLLELERWTFTCTFLLPDDEALESPLSAGPIRIFQGYESRDGDVLQEFFNADSSDEGHILHTYLSYPMEKIWEERKVKAPDVESDWGFILDEIIGENDTCAQCHKQEGLNLWGESNYEYMAGVSTFSVGNYPMLAAGFYKLLKGKMEQSFTTTDFLLKQFESLRPEAYSKLMSDLFDLKTSEFDSWNKSDWLCEDCLKRFISPHLHLWLLDRKRKAGVTIPEDCWYGYNCRTQTHKAEHAQKLNHWCEPTRGD